MERLETVKGYQTARVTNKTLPPGPLLPCIGPATTGIFTELARRIVPGTPIYILANRYALRPEQGPLHTLIGVVGNTTCSRVG
jgi:hypothetical protein